MQLHQFGPPQTAQPRASGRWRIPPGVESRANTTAPGVRTQEYVGGDRAKGLLSKGVYLLVKLLPIDIRAGDYTGADMVRGKYISELAIEIFIAEHFCWT